MDRWIRLGKNQRLRGVAALAVAIAIALRCGWRLYVLSPPAFQRQIALSILWAVFAVYGSAVLIAPTFCVAAMAWILWSRRAGELTPRLALGGLAMGGSLLVGLALIEGGAAYHSAASRRPVWLPGPADILAADKRHRAAESRRGRREAAAPGGAALQAGVGQASASNADCYFVVIGESSGRGEPYDPWLSVGQIVGWQLERVFPGRHVEVEVLARPGLNLRQAMERLQQLRRRPDAILVYSGHNEIQSRFSWSRTVAHYRHDPPALNAGPAREAARWSSVCSLIDRAMERQNLSFGTSLGGTRPFVDLPVCTPAEYSRIVGDFHDHLDRLVTYCERIGAVPLAVIPPGNLGRFAPCRSILDAGAGLDERNAFAREFGMARSLEATDPDRAIASYRRLIEDQPGFAESHFRLARLLESAGRFQEANEHYIQAGDLDGLPMRCQAPVRNVFHEVAAAHQSLILIDGPRVLELASRRGIVDDELIQDGQHPTLKGYAALAQDVLAQLSARSAFAWAGRFPVPRINVSECAVHFGIDSARWAEVCRRAAWFYKRTAHIRHDPADYLAMARRYDQAAAAIRAGVPPEETGVPGVGVAREAHVERDARYVLKDQN